jgi:hypothetical protein
MKKNGIGGILLIGLSSVIAIGFGGLFLSESIWSSMYQSDSRYQTLHAKVFAFRPNNPFVKPYDGRADYREMEAIADSYQTQAGITAFILSLIWAGGGVFAARVVAQKYKTPPVLYLVAFGIIPGILAFIGWRQIINARRPATQPI